MTTSTEPATPLRDQVRAILEKRLSAHLDEDLLLGLEKGIYNESLEEAIRRGVRQHWENPDFCEVYKLVARRVVANLDPAAYVGNTRLLERLRDGEFTPSAVAGMSARELYPEHWQALADEQLKRETTLLEGSQEHGCDFFKCKRCGKSRTRYWEMQTRSADEPMTIFIRCLNCGKEWRQ